MNSAVAFIWQERHISFANVAAQLEAATTEGGIVRGIVAALGYSMEQLWTALSQ